MPVTFEPVIDEATGRPVIDKATGMPAVNAVVDGPLPGEEQPHVCITGPGKGVIRMADGTLYDVTAPVIQISEQHVGKIGFHLLKQMDENGTLTTFLHGPDYDGPTCTITGSEDFQVHGHVQVDGVTMTPPISVSGPDVPPAAPAG